MEKYLRIGKASDLKEGKDRVVFRFFEMVPGLLSWGALFLVVFLSWYKPLWVSLFIIAFVIFWLLRTIYFSFHLWTAYRKIEKNQKKDWIKELDLLPLEWEKTYHLVIVPMYKESLQILRGTFKALEDSDYPKDKMIVVLACEEKVRDFVSERSEKVKEEFGSKFLSFDITWHPENLKGEIPGKGSNETWAAKKAKDKIDSLGIDYKDVVFSSFDADTCVKPGYFSCLTYFYLTSSAPTRTSFQPVPLFTNNIWQAPVISRVFSFSSTFWHSMNQERPEKIITFSSHSMSFKALVDVGFKQTNVVSDDSRIFWQCFLKYDGDYRAEPLYYPVLMDANAAKSFWRTLINIYKQQRRWAFGVGDIPYFLFGFLKNKKIPFSKKVSLGLEMIEGHFSWATASIMIFLLGWLPLVLGGGDFSHSLISYNLPVVVSRIMTVSMLGLIGSAYLSLLLLPPRPPKYGKLKYPFFVLGWALFPVIMIFFTALPALDAQTRWLTGKYLGFWPTEKFRK